MSLDQAILESVDAIGKPTLRLYAWEPATLSLGYFQSLASREQHSASAQSPIVRRASGGGAIMHHHEITYSVVLPSRDRWSNRNSALYRTVHDGIIELFAHFDVSLKAFEKDRDPAPESPNDFLCFNRRTDGDLVLRGYKVVGSAQRRAKNALLQHGSILLKRSEFAPELPGIFELSQQEISRDKLLESLSQKICRQLGFEAENGDYSRDELELARQIDKNRFSNNIWTAKLRTKTSN